MPKKSAPDLTQRWRDIIFSAHDGLTLYARHYPAAAGSQGAVLCLPGLTRNSRDFAVLAYALSKYSQNSLDVYCLDLRGRGLSERDKNWRNYSPYVELLDVLDFLTMTGLHDVSIIGTSSGGIIAMMLAVARPSMLRAVILNDIGPAIEPRGISRITKSMGQPLAPATWHEAALIIKKMNEKFFPALKNDEWNELARQWFNEVDGLPVPSYDPNIIKSLSALLAKDNIPSLWPKFSALYSIPTLIIRGEMSDILSEATLAEMEKYHPRITAFKVKCQGHAPLLRDKETIDTISTFLHLAVTNRIV